MIRGIDVNRGYIRPEVGTAEERVRNRTGEALSDNPQHWKQFVQAVKARFAPGPLLGHVAQFSAIGLLGDALAVTGYFVARRLNVRPLATFLLPMLVDELGSAFVTTSLYRPEGLTGENYKIELTEGLIHRGILQTAIMGLGFKNLHWNTAAVRAGGVRGFLVLGGAMMVGSVISRWISYHLYHKTENPFASKTQYSWALEMLDTTFMLGIGKARSKIFDLEGVGRTWIANNPESLGGPDPVRPRFVLKEGDITASPVGQSDGEVAFAYSIETTEREMAAFIGALTFWHKKVARTLPALSRDRSGGASLTIILSTGKITEVIFELQSKADEGEVELVALHLSQGRRETLKEFLQDLRTAALRPAAETSAEKAIDVMSEVGELAKHLAAAKSVVFLTGAGVSEESGISTFRGPDGWWRNLDPKRLATPQAFAEDPQLVWEWYSYRRERIRTAAPNAAHLALAELERRIPKFTLVTQNVDGLHQRAGSQNMLELHGNIWRTRCTSCGEVRSNDDTPIQILPYCEGCSGLLRPDVVWFGEPLDPVTLRRVLGFTAASDLLLVIGTSGVVRPAAELVSFAGQQGVTTVGINPEPPTDPSLYDHFLRGKAGDFLPSVVTEFKKRKGL